MKRQWLVLGMWGALVAPPGAWAGAPAADVAEIEALLTRAQAAYEQALALEHGWAVTEPLMEQARQALAGGDPDAARELAARALLTAEKSVEQAQTEAEAWKGRVLGS